MSNDAPYLAEFCEDFAPQARGFLVPHAAEVILMTRIGSIRLATQYFSKKFGRKFSTKPINDIIAKVKRGEIVVTEEEIAAKAKCVPLAAQFVEKCPWMLNPRSSKTLTEEPTPTEKKAAATKREAKKVGKAATTPPKKTPERKQIEEAPPKPSIKTQNENWNQKSPKEEGRNELLEAMDAELGPAGLLID